MNRREFLAAGFKLGAAGLLLPAIEPIRRYWSLDRTMIRDPYQQFADATGVPANLLKAVMAQSAFPRKVVIGDYTSETTIFTTDSSKIHVYDVIWIDREPMWVVAKNGNEISVIREFGVGPDLA